MNKYLTAWKEGRRIDRANDLSLGISHPLYMKMRNVLGAALFFLICLIGVLVGRLGY